MIIGSWHEADCRSNFALTKISLVRQRQSVSIPSMSMLSRFFLFLSILCAVLAPLHAVVVSEAPAVAPAENSAVISWGTDVECGTTVRFGTKPDQLTKKVEGEVGTKHKVQVNELLPGTTYYYSIGTSKKSLQTGNFVTKGKGPPVAPPVKAPANEPAKTAPQVAKSSPPPAVPAKPTYTPPPTAQTWGDRYSLQDHFNRHGADFNARNPDDYAAKAWLFLRRAIDEGLPAKLDDSDGTIRVWEQKSRTFAAYNRNFTTKTFFKPNSADYFQRQPGKPVRLRPAPPKP